MNKRAQVDISKRASADQALDFLAWDRTKQTCPRIMSEILHELGFDSFRTNHPLMGMFFRSLLTDNLPLCDLREATVFGLAENPPLLKFIEIALDKNWLKPTEKIEKAINYLYFLEHINQVMQNDAAFMIEVRDQMRDQRLRYKVNPKNPISLFARVLIKSKNLFLALKISSVEPFIPKELYTRLNDGEVLNKAAIKTLLDAGKINLLEAKLLDHRRDASFFKSHSSLVLNIFEAVITDQRLKMFDNALAGYSLVHLIQHGVGSYKSLKVHVGSENYQPYGTFDAKLKTLADPFDKTWINLYNSWNIAFVLNQNNHDAVVPKLLIPSVLSPKPYTYMTSRISSLWFSLYFSSMKIFQEKADVQVSNSREMASCLGSINREYALELCRGQGLDAVDGYQRFAKRPYWNFTKSMFGSQSF